MSYCRDNGKDSDVYLVATEEETPNGHRNFWCCIRCRLAIPRLMGMIEVRYTDMNSLLEVLHHLEKHREAGHKVPERAFKRVRREIAASDILIF